MTRTYAPTPAPAPQKSGSHPAAPTQAKESTTNPDTLLERSAQLGQNFEQAEFSAESLQPTTAGRPLPKFLREKMESAFETDFSAVRVHEDGNAEKIGALAYTRGHNLHFASGQFRPHSAEGQKVIGHELTHVMQQRAGRVKVPLNEQFPINTASELEQEANTLGAKAAKDDVARINKPSSTWSAIPQVLPVQALGRKKNTLIKKDDSDKPQLEDLGGGTANKVYKATYQKPIGETNTNVGYFKPEFEPELDQYGHVIDKNGNAVAELGGSDTKYLIDSEGKRIPTKDGLDFRIGAEPKKEIPGLANNQGIWEGDARMSARAVASSTLDKHLGLNALSEEVFAEHNINGSLIKGSVSADVGGYALSQGLFGDQDPIKGRIVDQIPNKAEPQNYKLRKDHTTYDEFSRTKLTNIKDEKGEVRGITQKGFSNLALLDAITNQTDRHGGNIKYDPITGTVKGIDNDVAFGKKVAPTTDSAFSSPYRQENKGKTPQFKKPQDKAVRLPNLVDEETANKILALKGKNLNKILNEGRQKHEQLSDAEIEATKQRLKAVKNHIKMLKKEKLLVGQKGGRYKTWGDDTLSATMSDTNEESSYLKRHLEHYDNPDSKHVTEEAFALELEEYQKQANKGSSAQMEEPSKDSELGMAIAQSFGTMNADQLHATTKSMSFSPEPVLTGLEGKQEVDPPTVKPTPDSGTEIVDKPGKQEVDPPPTVKPTVKKQVRFAESPTIKYFERDEAIAIEPESKQEKGDFPDPGLVSANVSSPDPVPVVSTGNHQLPQNPHVTATAPKTTQIPKAIRRDLQPKLSKEEKRAKLEKQAKQAEMMKQHIHNFKAAHSSAVDPETREAREQQWRNEQREASARKRKAIQEAEEAQAAIEAAREEARVRKAEAERKK